MVPLEQPDLRELRVQLEQTARWEQRALPVRPVRQEQTARQALSAQLVRRVRRE
jgi:hypothetical protein